MSFAHSAKTRDFLKSFMLENEDGFTIDLETVYYAGVSNPVHRKAEMMATMKGAELIAESRGDKAVFLTVTCPSKYHATTENGHPNPKWNGATMRDSSDYLVNTFLKPFVTDWTARACAGMASARWSLTMTARCTGI